MLQSRPLAEFSFTRSVIGYKLTLHLQLQLHLHLQLRARQQYICIRRYKK